jgi:hypothetical protein
MAGVYTVTFDNVSVSAAQDLFEITPADDKPIRVLGWNIDNVGGTADAGDAQEELLRLTLRAGYTSSGSAGSAPTPIPVVASMAAAGFAAEVNNTSLATTGTTQDHWNGGMNVRVPAPFWLPYPQCCPIISQAETRIVLRLVTAPADAVSMSGTMWIEELG